MSKIRVAFVKFAGLAAGGTERWLQMIAANLPSDQFVVDYFYCDAAPYIGSRYKHADTDPDRLQYMQQKGVNLIKFRVGAKDVTKSTHDWVETDFWEKFDSSRYDFVQTVKAGPAEYPYYLMPIPVIERVALNAGVDRSENLAWSFHASQWLHEQWIEAGGDRTRSSVVPIPVLGPAATGNLRMQLGIPKAALVGGFHQRVDDDIFSAIPLQAFAKVTTPDRHFVVMGGSHLYQRQAARLGLANVHFVGHSGSAARISEFLNSLDVFAHGRRDGETFGTVLAEAMIHGLPCLSHSSLVGNNNAQIETMGPGGLFAHGRDEYAAKLLMLFEDGTVRKKLADKAMAHATRYYSLDACVRKVGETYKQLSGVSAVDNSPRSALPYEYSRRGYLMAAHVAEGRGAADDLSVTGNLQDFEIDLLRHLLPRMKIAVDIGAGSGPFCLVAARDIGRGGRVIAYETRPECLSDLRQAVYLNNWEDRLDIRSTALAGNEWVAGVAAAADTLDHQFEQTHFEGLDLIRIGPRCSALTVLKGAEGVIARYSPVLMIGMTGPSLGPRPTSKANEPPMRWLRDHGYAVYQCTTSLRLVKVAPASSTTTPATYLCLKIGLQKQWEAPIRTWAFKYRVWRHFRRWRSGDRKRSPGRRSRLEKVLRNPRAAMGPISAWVAAMHRNPAGLGRRGDDDTNALPPERLQ